MEDSAADPLNLEEVQGFGGRQACGYRNRRPIVAKTNREAKNRDEFYGAEIRGRGGVRSGALGRLEPSSAQQERAMREGIRDRESGNQVVVDGVRRGLGAVGRCCLVEDVVMW